MPHPRTTTSTAIGSLYVHLIVSHSGDCEVLCCPSEALGDTMHKVAVMAHQCGTQLSVSQCRLWGDLRWRLRRGFAALVRF